MELADRHTDMFGMMRRSVFPCAAAGLLAASILTGACASSGAVPRPFPVPGSAGGAVDAGDDEVGSVPAGDQALVETALSFKGVPYRNGGSDPQGFDCSGFTQYVYAQYGVALPREVRDQFELGTRVKAGDAVVPGDLLFFTTVARGPTHVAIAIGGDEFVHAPSSTGVVRVERLSTKYWATRYLGARRVMPL